MEKLGSHLYKFGNEVKVLYGPYANRFGKIAEVTPSGNFYTVEFDGGHRDILAEGDLRPKAEGVSSWDRVSDSTDCCCGHAAVSHQQHTKAHACTACACKGFMLPSRQGQVNQPTARLTLKRLPETNEWKVCYMVNNRCVEDSSYYTDDEQDARDTMKLMQKNISGGKRDAQSAPKVGDQISWKSRGLSWHAGDGADTGPKSSYKSGKVLDVEADGTLVVETKDGKIESVGPNRVKIMAQTILSKPDNNKIVNADPDLEALRAEFNAMQTKIAEVQAQGQTYMDALAQKAAAANGMSPEDAEGGLATLETEASRMQEELNEKLKAIPATFVKFKDQVTFAKVQTARLNDAAWKQIIDQARVRGRGVMKRVVTVLDQVSILFKKMTADIEMQEFGPGELTPEKMTKLVDKNKTNVDKINQYTQTQQDVATKSRMQKYFLDNAQGKIQKPGTKSAAFFRAAQAESAQMEFDFMQDLIEQLGDSLTDLTSLTNEVAQAASAPAPVVESSTTEEAYPLPKVAAKKPFQFSVAGTSHGLQKLQRVWASKKS